MSIIAAVTTAAAILTITIRLAATTTALSVLITQPHINYCFVQFLSKLSGTIIEPAKAAMPYCVYHIV